MSFELNEEKYTELMMADLLVYVFRIFLKDNPDKGEIIATLVNKWSDKVDADSTFLMKKWAKTISAAGEQDMTEDVAMIMLDISNTEKTVVKKEFKDSILKTLLQEVGV